VAVALALVVGLLFVGRARSASSSIRWVPSPGGTWQYQLSGAIDTSVDADVFDVDAATPRAVVDAIHERGSQVVCYIDAGAWESYRADAQRFPRSVLGKAVDGWPDERWLDIRRIDVLRPMLRDRLDRCARRGFDGVEFDWADGYLQDTGFPLTRADQLRFDGWLARAAHARGLAAGLKNALPLLEELVGTFDFAVNEQCFQYRECWRYRPFLEARRAVLNVEYRLWPSDFCDRAESLGIDAMRKHRRLDAWRATCPA
jgi:hypothetical protein